MEGSRFCLQRVASTWCGLRRAASLLETAAGRRGLPALRARAHSRPCLPAPASPAGYTFKSTTPGRRGLTALHLASLVNDGGAIAGLVSEKCAGEGGRPSGSACLHTGSGIECRGVWVAAGLSCLPRHVPGFELMPTFTSPASCGRPQYEPLPQPAPLPCPGPGLQTLWRAGRAPPPRTAPCPSTLRAAPAPPPWWSASSRCAASRPPPRRQRRPSPAPARAAPTPRRRARRRRCLRPWACRWAPPRRPWCAAAPRQPATRPPPLAPPPRTWLVSPAAAPGPLRLRASSLAPAGQGPARGCCAGSQGAPSKAALHPLPPARPIPGARSGMRRVPPQCTRQL